MILFHWVENSTEIPYIREILIYAQSIEKARKIYGRKRVACLDDLILTNNYIENPSEGLRELLHYRMNGRCYRYTPSLCVLYMDDSFKKRNKLSDEDRIALFGK